MKAILTAQATSAESRGDPPDASAALEDGVDLSLLAESLAMTVWERMLANDEALRFSDELRTAVLKSREKP